MQVEVAPVPSGPQFEAPALAATSLDSLGPVALGLEELPLRFAAGHGQAFQGVALRLLDQRFPLLERARRGAEGVDDIKRRMGVLDRGAHHLDADAEEIECGRQMLLPVPLDVVSLAGQHGVQRVSGKHGAQGALGARLDQERRIGCGEGEGGRIGDPVVDAGRDFHQVLVPGQHESFERRRLVEAGVAHVPLVGRFAGRCSGSLGWRRRPGRADGGHPQALRLDPGHPIDRPRPAPVQARTELSADVPAEALHQTDFLRCDRPHSGARPDREEHERRRAQQPRRQRPESRRAVLEGVFEAVDGLAAAGVPRSPAGGHPLRRSGESGEAAEVAAGTLGHCPALVEQTHAVQDDQQGGGLMDDRRGGRRQPAEGGEADGDEVDAEGEDQDAAADPRHHPARVPQQRRQVVEPVGQQDDLGRLRGEVGGAVADRDADAGGRERRRIVDPVAHHENVAVAAREVPEPPHLVLGKELRVDLVDAGQAADRPGRRPGVAGQHDDRIDAGSAQVGDRLGGFLAQRIGEGDGAGEGAVDRDRQPRFAAAGSRLQALGDGVEIVPGHHLGQQRRVADRDLVAKGGGGHAPAGVQLEALGLRQLELPLAGLGHQRPAEQVFRGHLRARRELEQAVLGNARGGQDRGQSRTPAGQSTRLVEHAGIDPRQGLDHVAALDQGALARQPRDRRSHGRRRRQHQGARTGDDQGRHRAHHLAGEEVDGGGGDEHGRQEVPCQPVRRAHNARAPALRVLDQVGDAGDRGVAAGAFGADVEDAVLVQAAAPHRIADAEFGGQRFAGHAALVDRGLAALDRAVHRQALAGEHPHQVADFHLVQGDELFAAVAQHPSLVRLAGDEAGDRSLGAVDRPVLDPLADQHDEHDLGGGEVLADPDRRAGRDGNRQVRREVPLEQVEDRVADERIARDQGQDQRQVDAGDRTQRAGQIQQQQDADRAAERDVADPLQQAVAVAVTVAVPVVVEVSAHEKCAPLRPRTATWRGRRR